MTPPSVNFDTSPARSICVNEEWLSYVIGRLWALEKESFWSSDGYNASQEITSLVDQWTNRNCFMLPIATIQMFAGEDDSIPAGWLKCAGQPISRVDYADLFSIIGTVYGDGDGTTTFNLPDLQGRFPLGDGTGDNLTNRSIGQTGGLESEYLTLNMIPAHQHEIYELAKYKAVLAGGAAAVGWWATGTSGSYKTGYAGGGLESVSKMPPFLVVNFIIYTGV